MQWLKARASNLYGRPCSADFPFCAVHLYLVVEFPKYSQHLIRTDHVRHHRTYTVLNRNDRWTPWKACYNQNETEFGTSGSYHDVKETSIDEIDVEFGWSLGITNQAEIRRVLFENL